VPGSHTRKRPQWVLGLLALAVLQLSACGSASRPPSSGIPPALLAETRPIGHGARFDPPARGPAIGRCAPRLGARYGVHVELFAANRVVIVAQGIGTRGPLRFAAGRISGAECYGELVTLEPTGVVLVRPGARLSVGDLFRVWGQPLSRRRMASFKASPKTEVAAFVNGRRWHGSPASVPLTAHVEIVLEVGPHVPPHHIYTFPPGT
jgi:hypothetical protein